MKWYGDDFLKKLRKVTPDALFESAEMLVEAAKANAPEMTGNLKESGYAANHEKSTYKTDKRHNKEIKPKEDEAVAAFAIFYARFIEYGTAHNGARPFMRRALDEVKGEIGEKFGVRIGRNFK